MKITSNYIDKLNGKISIEIDKKDYTEQVDRELHNLSHKANMPGFRKGHVPVGLIRKKHGKCVINILCREHFMRWHMKKEQESL